MLYVFYTNLVKVVTRKPKTTNNKRLRGYVLLCSIASRVAVSHQV